MAFNVAFNSLYIFEELFQESTSINYYFSKFRVYNLASFYVDQISIGQHKKI